MSFRNLDKRVAHLYYLASWLLLAQFNSYYNIIFSLASILFYSIDLMKQMLFGKASHIDVAA